VVRVVPAGSRAFGIKINSGPNVDERKREGSAQVEGNKKSFCECSIVKKVKRHLAGRSWKRD